MAEDAGLRQELSAIWPARHEGRAMRLILRVLGTWLLGLAVVLLIIDGTKSLAANALVLTPLGETWSTVNAPSLSAVRAFFETRFFADFLGRLFSLLLTYPAFAVIAVPGLLLAVVGRARRRQRFVQADQF
jgi:hypothetical protein